MLFKALRIKQSSPGVIQDIKDLSRLILSYRGQIEPFNGETALQVACKNSDVSLEVLDFLLQKGEKPCRAWVSQFRESSYTNSPRYLVESAEIKTSRNLLSRLDGWSIEANKLVEQKHLNAVRKTLARYTQPPLPNFSSMPLEVKELIISYLVPQKAAQKEDRSEIQMTCEEIKSCARQLLNLALLEKDLFMIISQTSQTLSFFKNLWKLRYQQDLMKKYSYYDHPPYWEERPHLLDALCSGCPFSFAPHTFEEFTADIEKDILPLCDLPRRKSQTLKELATERRISVLGAACINPHVPLSLVKFILYRDGETCACRIWYPTSPSYYSIAAEDLLKELDSLRSYLDWERFEDIHDMFTEFVAYVAKRDEEMAAACAEHEAEESYTRWSRD